MNEIQAAGTRASRWSEVDALRGFAMLWMTVFHFSFDLSNAGYTQQNFYTDGFWTWQRTCIVSLFLLCAGMGQAIALHQGQAWPRFWRRWAQIVGCAMLVTAGSYWMFPHSFIYFGVLHSIAVMLIVVRLTAGWGRWLWLLGALAIASKFLGAYAIDHGLLSAGLNAKAWSWVGWISVKPITEDYVPIFPWLGVMWWGVAAGQWWIRRRGAAFAVRLGRMASALSWLGRWSLSYYMLHQPVLLGALALWAFFRHT